MSEARKADVRFQTIQRENCSLNDGIHVWRFGESSAKEFLLDKEEMEQSTKYHSPSAKTAFIAGRSGIRRAASLYTKIPPQDLKLSIGANGKPFFENAGIHFNLSHSGSAVVAAFSAFPVGIDIESRGRSNRFVEIARRYFHPAEAEIVFRSGDEELFLKLWTGKEAMLKLSGAGLAGGLQEALPGTAGTGTLYGREVRLTTFSFEKFSGTVASFQQSEVKGWFQF